MQNKVPPIEEPDWPNCETVILVYVYHHNNGACCIEFSVWFFVVFDFLTR